MVDRAVERRRPRAVGVLEPIGSITAIACDDCRASGPMLTVSTGSRRRRHRCGCRRPRRFAHHRPGFDRFDMAGGGFAGREPTYWPSGASGTDMIRLPSSSTRAASTELTYWSSLPDVDVVDEHRPVDRQHRVDEPIWSHTVWCHRSGVDGDHPADPTCWRMISCRPCARRRGLRCRATRW